jgi:protoporphyrinogen oxidase
MMWEACAEKTRAMGGQIEMACKVTGCAYDEVTSTWTVQFKNGQGQMQTLEAEHVISSAPMRELVRGLTPKVSDAAMHAADSLKYRDFLTVMLILKDRQKFDDNWIYIHDPASKWAGCRPSVPGRRQWFPTRKPLAMAWNIFASSMTASGTQAMKT